MIRRLIAALYARLVERMVREALRLERAALLEFERPRRPEDRRRLRAALEEARRGAVVAIREWSVYG